MEKDQDLKRAQLYPTLRCTLKCSYCSNRVPGEKTLPSYQAIRADEWQEVVKKFDMVVITGGEPLTYPGLEALVNPAKEATIYTNMSLPIKSFIDKVKDPSKLRVRASYHPDGNYLTQFLLNVDVLKAFCLKFTIHMVDFEKAPELRSRVFKKYAVDVGIDYDQGRHEHRKDKAVKCWLGYPIYGPDGNAYHCVSRMLRKKRDLKEPEPFTCDEPHKCAPCDLASMMQTPCEGVPEFQESTGDG